MLIAHLSLISLKQTKENVCSFIGFALAIINLKMILQKFLGLLALTNVLVFSWANKDYYIIKNKNLIFAAFLSECGLRYSRKPFFEYIYEKTNYKFFIVILKREIERFLVFISFYIRCIECWTSIFVFYILIFLFFLLFVLYIT